MSIQQFFAQLDGTGYLFIRVILSILWQSTILLAATGALAWMLRKRVDTVRHALWTAAVLSLPLLPLLSLGGAKLGSPRTDIAVMPVYQALANTPAQTVRLDQSPSIPSTLSTDAVQPEPIPQKPSFNPFDYPWAMGFSGYLFALSGLLLWMFAGKLRIRRWLKEGEAVIDSRVLDIFRKAGEALGLRDEIPVMEHPDVPAPLVYGIFRPVIMLPNRFAGELSDMELRSVAFHELTHVRRRDTLVFTLISIIRTAFFFQPLLWLAARRISFLTELACDRSALDAGNDPSSYARLLARIAFRLPNSALSTEMAAGILLSNSAFFLRVREILSDRGDRVRKLSRWALAGIVIIGMTFLMIVTAFPLTEKEKGPWDDMLRVASKGIAPFDATGAHSSSYAVPFTGSNQITVDGNLSEWQSIGAEPARLVRGSRDSLQRAGRLSPPSEQNLSAILQCAADNDFFYLAVAVRDDKLDFSNNTFPGLWSRDCLEVLFFGNRGRIRSGQILITLDSDGSLIVGGSDPIAERKYPYIWESLGARAALKTTSTGYTVELAVPLSVLEWSGWTGNRLRGMNVRVYDRDYPQKEKYLVEWSDRNGAGCKTLAFPSVQASGHVLYQTKDCRVIRNVLMDIANNKTDEAIHTLRTAGNGHWVNPMRGALLKWNSPEATDALKKAMGETRSPCLRRWLADPRPSFREKIARQPWFTSLFYDRWGSTESQMADRIRKAPTPEKKAAIERLLQFWRNYRCNDHSILLCSDIIFKADRNIPVIERVAEYSLERRAYTMVYIDIAKYAAKSKKASQEFVDLASVVERMDEHKALVKLAGKVSRAKTETELQPLRDVIEALK